FLKSVKKVNPAAFIIDSSRGIPLLPAGEEEHHHHHAHHAHEKGEDHDGHDHDRDHHDHDHDHGKAPGNPHLFASPFTAQRVVKNIAEGLAKADRANGALYNKNAAEYGKKLAALCEKFVLASKDFRGKKIVTQHSVFDYLAFHTGLKVAGTLGDGHENALNARMMLRLVKKIRESGACVVFTEPQYSPRAAKTLGKEGNIPVVQLDPVAGGPSDATPDYYEKVMEKNLAAMKKVLIP
ncbi:MAG: zinc ABC transporter substrate-binding protein, partial [Lentisphaeria bacterium]|nr:zinc ABC transporter substrate-binding protein [Lentisphaeria bacterium]